MLSKKSVNIFWTIIFSSASVFSQTYEFPERAYPQDYFAWPVDAAIGIVANFGELRPNHYHMGLDCRTDQRENLPILAAADGYISRVKIEPIGFGRSICISHANGLTTLYAHLNDFYPALENYITEQQYKLESWKVTLDIPSGLFPVTKGQFIAYSGNTGGSQGPHLHFEIRDTKTDKVLNPLLFGFPLPDNVPPVVSRIAMYDRTKSTFEQSPKFLSLKKVNGVYQTMNAVQLVDFSKVSFAISASDQLSGSSNPNGIYEAVLYDNHVAVVGFRLDSISYDETRYLNAHIDYRLKNSGGPFVQHLSRLPGYPKGTYTEINGDGVIDLSDHLVHNIVIEIRDANGDVSKVNLSIQENDNASTSKYLPNNKPLFGPGLINVFENNNIRFHMPEPCLYDSLRFVYQESIGINGKIFLLHNGNIPVHSYFPISIKNTTPSSHYVMHRWWGDKDDYKKCESIGDWYKSEFRAFGYVELINDLLPPAIVPVGFRNGMNMSKQNRLAFVISDNTKELINFRAELDGKWLRFSNDKGRTFIYRFDEHCPPGQHTLKLSVEDLAGNKTERVYSFSR
jgi:hypothetical protein